MGDHLFQLLYYMRNVRFQNNMGIEIRFDENGDPPGIFELLNWQIVASNELQLKVVGWYDSNAPAGQKLQLEDQAIMWKEGARNVSLKPRVK